MSFPTSYIKTEGSQVTRVADVAQITGDNFSEWYRQGEGSLYFDCHLFEPIPYNYYFARLYKDPSNWLSFRTLAGDYRVTLREGGDYYVLSGGNYQQAPSMITYFPGGFGSANAGNNYGTQDSYIPNFNTLQLTESSNHLNGHIKKLAFYPKRLPNAVLQTLTEE